MMDYGKQLKHLPKDKDRYVRMVLLSSLSSLRMLKKLMAGKNRGKKPFSEAFCYSEKIKELDDAETMIAYALESSSYLDVISSLEKTKQISLSASEEIKMSSLKNDFIWISSVNDLYLQMIRHQTSDMK